MLETITAAAARASAADWLLLAGGALLALYAVGTWRHDFFKRRGLTSARGKLPFLGNTSKGFFGITSFTDLVQNIYREGQGHSVFGLFQFQQPIFLIRDPSLLKTIMVKDFDHFTNRVQVATDISDPIFSQTLFNLLELTENDISAQSVGFFFAGFETVSTALCFTAHALSRHAEAQERLQQEVDAMMRETGGKPTYEAIQGMKYLDAVINESLRLFPPAQIVTRVCREDVVLPTETSGPVHFKKSDALWVPIYGIHRDPAHWPDPDKFDPERFSEENKRNIKPFTYMPFGGGPRFCIAQRLALLEMKLGVVNLLAHFHIRPSPRTVNPLQYETGATMSVRGGFWNLLIPRNV